MATKRNFTTVIIVILVIAVAILSFTVAQSGNGQITLPVDSTQTPTIVAPQSAQSGNQLAWDCDGCPN